MDRMNRTPPPSPHPVPDQDSSRPESPVKEKERSQASTSLHHRKTTPSTAGSRETQEDPLFTLFRQQEQRIVEARHKLEKPSVEPEQPLSKKQQKNRRKKERTKERETRSKNLELVPVSTDAAKATPTPKKNGAGKVDLTNPLDFPALDKPTTLVQMKKGRSKPEAEAQLRELASLQALAEQCRAGEKLILAMAEGSAHLPEKERYQLWWGGSLNKLQKDISDIALECDKYIEADPIKGTVNLKRSGDIVLTESAKQMYHQTMAYMQHFLTTFYALHADSFRCYLLAHLDDALTSGTDMDSKQASQLFESFANAVVYHILALSYISPQSQTIIKKIDVSPEAKAMLFNQAAGLINRVYEMTSHIVTCSWKRIQQHQGDEAITHHIKDVVLPGFSAALKATGLQGAVSRCHQFYRPSDDPVVHFQELCHQLIACGLLNNASLALGAVHTMRDLATPVEGACQIPACPPLEQLDHSDLLLYQEAFRAAIGLFVDLESAAKQTDDLVEKRNMTEHLMVSAESVTRWWTALFPPSDTPWLSESRKILKKVAGRNNQACQHFDTLMAAKIRTARKLAKSLSENNEHRKQHRSVQAEQIMKEMDKHIDHDESSTTSESNNTPEPSVSDIAIKLNWQELKDGTRCLKEGQPQYARQHFYRVTNCSSENKTPEQQAWALYGLADLYHHEASEIMDTQCGAAMAFLRNYHAKIQDNISPTSAEGRQFFHNVETFTRSMQDFAVAIKPVQKNLRELIDLTFSKENELDKDDDLMQCIADAQLDCCNEIRRLNDFAESLHTICEDRRSWIKGLRLPPRTGGASSQPDYEKLLKDIENVATSLKHLVDEFSQKLAKEEERLGQKKTKPGASNL